MSPLSIRLATAVVSAALAAALGAWIVSRRATADTVELVDGRERVDALLAAGAAEAPAAEPIDAASAAPVDPAWLDPLAAAPALVRRPVPENVARTLFPAIGRSLEYDERLLCRHAESFQGWLEFEEHPRGGMWIRTNAQGFRRDVDVRADRPDARVIVVGDSHVDGVCDNASSFPSRLEAALARRHPERSFEVLNGGTGSWNFYNYLGALEGFASYEPDLFVVVIYGGNDFYGDMALHAYHRRAQLPKITGRALRGVLHLGRENGAGIAGQYLVQAAQFHDRPGTEAIAREIAIGVTAEIARRCRERGIELLCVYLPPWPHAQPALCAEEVERAVASLGMPPEAYEVDERLAALWLDWLARAGVPAIDLRPSFRAFDRRALYWRTDHHLNLLGHRAVAETILPRVEELLGLER